MMISLAGHTINVDDVIAHQFCAAVITEKLDMDHEMNTALTNQTAEMQKPNYQPSSGTTVTPPVTTP